MLKIAVTKGRIEKDFCKMLTKSGFDIEPIINKERKLIIKTSDELEFIFVKSSDIITYLDYGVVDLGVVGKDTLIESDESKYKEILDLKIGNCKFCLASNPEYKNKIFDRKKIIATKYPKMTTQFFYEKNEQVDIVNLNGSIEVAPVLKMTDAIVDLVETGDTLRANGLEVIEEICNISTRLITNERVIECKKDELNNFISRLKIDGKEVNYNILLDLYEMIESRKINRKEGSYTNYLLGEGIDKICKKIGEEATETVIAAKNDNKENFKEELVGEICDLIYHIEVLMVDRNVSTFDIIKKLTDRHKKECNKKTQHKRGDY